MKQAVKIITFLLLLFLLTAEDCSNGGREPSMTQSQISMFDQMEKEFVKTELTAPDLIAFEKRAIQKLNELIDYLNFFADSSLDIEFRQQARKMIVESFASEDDYRLFVNQYGWIEVVNIELLNSAKGETLSLSVERTQMLEAMTSSDLDYVGKISYKLNISEERILKVRVLQSEKLFGSEQMKVWKIVFEV